MKKYIILIPEQLCNYIEQLNYEVITLQNLCPFIPQKDKQKHIIKIKTKMLELKIAQAFLINNFAPMAKGCPFLINFNISALITEVPNDTKLW